MRDKTQDDRFFNLTLFAIAYKIEAAGAYSPNGIVDVQLAIGLPPAHFGTQHEKFARYFLDRGVVDYTLNGEAYLTYINEAVCFPQALAATAPVAVIKGFVEKYYGESRAYYTDSQRFQS